MTHLVKDAPPSTMKRIKTALGKSSIVTDSSMSLFPISPDSDRSLAAGKDPVEAGSSVIGVSLGTTAKRSYIRRTFEPRPWLASRRANCRNRNQCRLG